MIKLISLDLDGTALNREGRLSDAVKAAIAKARAAGVRVIFNTGRPAPEAFAFIREAEADTLVSTLGGAMVADCASVIAPNGCRSRNEEIRLMVFDQPF